MNIKASKRIVKKLEEVHGVTMKEVHECFINQERTAILDTREEHQTNPPTHWIISETNRLRRLKVAFIVESDGEISIKSAYPPEPEAEWIYRRKSTSLF